jgi:hypothetical protein
MLNAKGAKKRTPKGNGRITIAKSLEERPCIMDA